MDPFMYRGVMESNSPPKQFQLIPQIFAIYSYDCEYFLSGKSIKIIPKYRIIPIWRHALVGLHQLRQIRREIRCIAKFTLDKHDAYPLKDVRAFPNLDKKEETFHVR